MGESGYKYSDLDEKIEHSHIGKAKKIIEGIITLDPETYYPLIKAFLEAKNLFSDKGVDIIIKTIALKETKEGHEKTQSLLYSLIRTGDPTPEEVEDVSRLISFKESDKNGTYWEKLERVNEFIVLFQKKIEALNCHKDDEEFITINEIINYIATLEKTENDNNPEKDEEIKKRILKINEIERLIMVCLLEKDDKGVLLRGKKKLLLELFNSLAISILKAEYTLFDNYSEMLDQLSGFSKKDYTIKTYLEIGRETPSPKFNLEIKRLMDHNLLKSIMCSLWYLIEQCKTITHCFDQKNFDSQLLFINNDRKQRVDTIYPQYHSYHKFISFEIVQLFEYAIESIIYITLIDHRFYYSPDILNKLFLATERIESLKRGINQVFEGLTLDLEDDTHWYYGNTGKEFDKIVQIVNLKSFTLIDQMIEYHNQKGEKFYNEYDIITYGVGNHQNLREKIKKEIFLTSEFDPENFSHYTKIKRNKYQEEISPEEFFRKDDGWYWEEIKLDNLSYSDIDIFNKASEKGIHVYCKFSEIIPLTKSYQKQLETPGVEIDENFQQKIEEIITQIKSLSLKKDKESGKDTISYNPTVLPYFIDFLYSLIDLLLKGKIEGLSQVEVRKKINDYNSLLKRLIKRFDEFVNYRYYDIPGLRFQPPYQECFYELCKSDDIGKPHPRYKIKQAPLQSKDITNYDTDSKKIRFFFLSAGLNPINLDLLRKKNKEYSSKLLETDRRISILQSTFDLQKTSKDTTENLQKITNTYTEKLEENNKHYMTLLGILGAFIAFATLSVGGLKAIDNTGKYILFMLSFIFALSVFVFLIRFKVSYFNERPVAATIYLIGYAALLGLLLWLGHTVLTDFEKDIFKPAETEKEKDVKSNEQQNTVYLTEENMTMIT